MANRTKSQMASSILEYLGVLGAGQSAEAEDSILVQRIIDSVYDQLRKQGLAPFASSAFPEWSQEPFVKVAAKTAAPYFGVTGQHLAEVSQLAAEGLRELGVQTEVTPPNVRTRSRFF